MGNICQYCIIIYKSAEHFFFVTFVATAAKTKCGPHPPMNIPNQSSIHPSSFSTSAASWAQSHGVLLELLPAVTGRGQGGTLDTPPVHRKATKRQKIKKTFAIAYKPTDNLEFLIHLTRMFLDFGKKAENLERTYPDTGAPHRKAPGPGSDSRPSCCEAPPKMNMH